MKKIDIGQLIAILANVGVVGGLALVALELRQTSNAILASTYQARAESSAAWDMQNADSEYRAPVVIKYLQEGRDSLSLEEEYRIDNLMQAGFKRQESEFYQYTLGLLDEVWYDQTFRHHMELWVPRWRDWGALDEGSYIREAGRPDFLEEIERFLNAPNLDAQRELFLDD